jgi:hypothetical protein
VGRASAPPLFNVSGHASSQHQTVDSIRSIGHKPANRSIFLKDGVNERPLRRWLRGSTGVAQRAESPADKTSVCGCRSQAATRKPRLLSESGSGFR